MENQEMKATQERKQQENQNHTQKTDNKNIKPNDISPKKPLVWDCGSTLYDSFELKSFEKQLYSAIHSRTLSMPHLPERKLPTSPPKPQQPPPISTRKLSSPSSSFSSNKFSRSLQKFIKSMFMVRSRQDQRKTRDRHEYFVIYDKSGALTTIPEVPEIDSGAFSPEITSLVRRTRSERFIASASIGISVLS